MLFCEKSLSMMLKKEENHPTLVFSNSILTNEFINKKYGTLYSKNYKPSLQNFLFVNAGFQGASMLLNRKLINSFLPILQGCKVHDYHISIYALLMGQVYFLPEVLAYYRRHENTATQNNQNLKARIGRIINNQTNLFNKDIKNYLKIFINKYQSQIPHKKLVILEDYLYLDTNVCFLKKIQIIFKQRFELRDSKLYLILKFIIINILRK